MKKKSDKNHLIESKMTINRQYDHKFKFMMLGDAGVGKTSIARCGNFPIFHQWYFVTKIVLTYCEKKIVLVIEKKLLKFEAEDREFSNFLRSLEQFIQIVKGQNNFLQKNAFLTFPWRFLISNKLEQLQFKLEKNGKS